MSSGPFESIAREARQSAQTLEEIAARISRLGGESMAIIGSTATSEDKLLLGLAGEAAKAARAASAAFRDAAGLAARAQQRSEEQSKKGSSSSRRKG